MMILLGQHGQQRDYYTGLDYIRIAAQTCDQNAPQGAYVYGMLLVGELPQINIPEHLLLASDVDTARIHVEKAAYLGFAKAQVKMGSAYELCQLGCDFNPVLSLHYYALAAHQGEPEAEMSISKWFLCGHEGVFEKNDELAFSYAQRAAQSGLPTAEFALGYFYEVGIFVPVDIKEARVWYVKAAKGGNKDASGRIESISRSKTLSRKDHETVAIARIKSQYASQAGKRPMPRGRMPPPPPIEPLEMPDPSMMSISSPPTPVSSAPPYYSMPHPRPHGPELPRSNSAVGLRPSAPPQGYRAASHGSMPMGYRPPPGPAAPRPGPPRHGGALPKLDIGYSAPLDAAAGPRARSKTPMGRQTAQPPPSRDSTPRPPSSMPPSVTSTKTAPPLPTSKAKQYPRPTRAPAPQTKGLPGKGPKTFDEMGVPATKSGGDCVGSLFYPCSLDSIC